MSRATLYVGDALETMRDMEAESVDAVVTDPPYGLSFMGKDWDHSIPGVPFWEAALKVAKPGAHLLAFGGTRTFHRLTCAIEDAGWEIRDCLMWVYGSGFPKSLDVGKAIDKAAGAEREIVGVSSVTGARTGSVIDDGKGYTPGRSFQNSEQVVNHASAPATDAAKQWDGWGTALKPAHEIIIMARKPYGLSGECGILVHKLVEAICQLPSYAKAAGLLSTLNQNGSGAVCDSALWAAVAKCSTPGDLSDLMDTWPSESAIPTSLSTALSWLATLADLLKHEKMFTTETATGLTTDLKTLNCSPSPITPATIIEAATGQRGTGSNAWLVDATFCAVAAKLRLILARTAQGPATSSEFVPNWEPIILARKPLTGTVAANVLEHGTGGLNIDACRISTLNAPTVASSAPESGVVAEHSGQGGTVGVSRWPANVVHDGSEEVVGRFPQTGVSAGGGMKRDGTNNNVYSRHVGHPKLRDVGHGDVGSAARFFYCAKASRSEREAGLEGMPRVQRGTLGQYSDGGKDKRVSAPPGRGFPTTNTHPTVKPVALMRWLCRLVTPPDGLILDPFCGSGSTGVAASLEGFRFIGIDDKPEYYEIARKRIAAASAQGGLFA